MWISKIQPNSIQHKIPSSQQNMEVDERVLEDYRPLMIVGKRVAAETLSV